jgi:hypothetical protein
MSKHKQPTLESPPSTPLKAGPPAPFDSAQGRPAPPPAKVEIGTCLGKMVDCPNCGKPAYVDHARGARTVTQVLSSQWWVLVKCRGYCGAYLSKIKTPVTPQPEPEPEVITKTLGEAVGRFVLCPRESCRAKAQAAWTLDLGHVVTCGSCQTRAYPGETVVELVA